MRNQQRAKTQRKCHTEFDLASDNINDLRHPKIVNPEFNSEPGPGWPIENP